MHIGELIEAIKEMRDEVAPQTLLTINGDIPDRQKVWNLRRNMVLMEL